MKKFLSLALLIPLACGANPSAKRSELVKKAAAAVAADENRCPICGYGQQPQTPPVPHIPKNEALDQVVVDEQEKSDDGKPKCNCGKPKPKPNPGRRNGSDDKSDRCPICSLPKPQPGDEKMTKTEAEANDATPKCGCNKPKPKPGQPRDGFDPEDTTSSDTTGETDSATDTESAVASSDSEESEEGATCPFNSNSDENS